MKNRNQSTSSCYSSKELPAGQLNKRKDLKASQSCQLLPSITLHFKVFALCSNASYTLSKEKGKSDLYNISYCIARLLLILPDFIPKQDCVI